MASIGAFGLQDDRIFADDLEARVEPVNMQGPVMPQAARAWAGRRLASPSRRIASRVRSGGLARRPLAIVFGQVALAQADRLGRHFDQFIFRDEFQCLFE